MSDDNDRRRDWNLFGDSDENPDEQGVFEDDGDDAKPDFFNGTGPAPKKKVKKPRYKRDDPRFWEEKEGHWEHLRPSRPHRVALWGVGIAAVIVILYLALNAIFGVRTANVEKYGYLIRAEERGKFFKTYELEMIPYMHNSYVNTPEAVEPDTLVKFSTTNKKIFDKMLTLKDSVVPVKVTYKIYNSRLPWRGETEAELTDVLIAKPAEIYPPEFIRNLKPRIEQPIDTLNQAPTQQN